MAGIAGIDTSGDTIFISKNHAEAQSTAYSWSLAGSRTAPQRFLCVDDTGDPASPTTLSTGAKIEYNGGTSLTLGVSVVAYWYGIEFKNGSGTAPVIACLTTVAGFQRYEQCFFNLSSSGSTGVINLQGSINWVNCTVSFGATGQTITPTTSGAKFTWIGGSYIAGAAQPTVLITGTSRNNEFLLDGVDLSAYSGTIFSLNTCGQRVVMRNCKIHASATLHAAMTGVARISMYDCDSGNTNYKIRIEDGSGTIVDEETIVRTGGASDGTTPISWKMTSNTGALEHYPLYSDEIQFWNDAVGSSVNVRIEVLRDSATALTDNVAWLEIDYLGDASYPISSMAMDKMANTLASPANQPSSSATWVTTGMSNPNKQYLDVSFTPQKKGIFIARVAFAPGAVSTLYVDPAPIIT